MQGSDLGQEPGYIELPTARQVGEAGMVSGAAAYQQAVCCL